ncbi:hypothetical protein P886_0048 [Alteromonadaceae bacterium 2753L.S.0a.02]|nr:hypothetical protein P886_0048 [Alteromonadaceae bacterium 2753L.S.0a.02]
MTTAITLGIVIVVSTEICYFVAKRRRANVALWVILGACFGPLAIPFVFFSTPKKKV